MHMLNLVYKVPSSFNILHFLCALEYGTVFRSCLIHSRVQSRSNCRTKGRVRKSLPVRENQGRMSRIFPSVKTFIQRRPLLFNSVVYGSFYTAAEFAQQSYARMFKVSEPASVNLDGLSRASERRGKPANWLYKLNETLGLHEQDSSAKSSMYNWPQLKRYAIYGCFLAGPILHGWYKWLDASYKGKSLKIILVKLFADQFILTPPLVTVFFISMSFMEGRADVFSECRAKFVHTFKTSCMYWLPVQFINFMLVPATFRVSFVSIAAFCWVNILCYLKSIPLADCEKGEIKY